MRLISQLKQTGRLLGCILLALQLITVLPAHSHAQDFPPPVLEMVRLINQARAQRGLPLYLLNPVLSQAAQAHVDDLLANRRLGHVGSDGSRVAGRLKRVGYATAQVSENWVYSRDLVRGFRWWMADPPHRANILHRSFTEIGVGMAPHPNGWGQVWVVDFATSTNGPAPESVLIGDPPIESIAVAAAAPAAFDGNTYVIQAGDTLDALARRLGIPWQRIAEYNGISDPTLLQVGQVLEIPGRAAETAADPAAATPTPDPAVESTPPATETPTEAPTEAPSANPAPESAPAPAVPTPKPTTHTVRAGESLASIAPRYGLIWQDLAAMNGLDSRALLQVGQVLRLSGAAPVKAAAPANTAASAKAAAPANTGGSTTHTVRAGESLATIAPRYGLTWQDLAAMNGLDGQTILQVGQVLRVGQAAPARASSPSRPTTVTVRKGDSLYSLAQRLKIDWQDLAKANGLTGKSTLQVGQVLRLP